MLSKIAVAVFLSIGLFFICHINPKEVWYKLSDKFHSFTEKITSHQKKQPLKTKVATAQGKIKISMRQRTLSETSKILEIEGQAHSIDKTKRFCFILGVAGALFGVLIRNFALAPVLAALLYFIPLWIVKYRSADYAKQTTAELETALSIITISYMRSDNIVLAVECNLEYLNEPVKTPFLKFMGETNIISADIVRSLHKLKRSFSNPVFQEWCDSIIQCQENSQMKYILLPIVRKFSDIREIQYEYDTEIRNVMKDHLMMTAGVVLGLPVIYLVNKAWFLPLVTTGFGKLVLAALFLSILFATDKALNLSEPIDIQQAQKKKKGSGKS